MEDIKWLKEYANELISLGDSHEKAKGLGMLYVISVLEKYKNGFDVLSDYINSLPNEEKQKVIKKLYN